MIVEFRKLADSLTCTDRSYSFAKVGRETIGGVLLIEQGKHRQLYVVQEETADPLYPSRWRVFLLAKNKYDEIYQVIVSRVSGEVGHCTCTGFGRWKNCKHEDTMRDLVQELKLGAL